MSLRIEQNWKWSSKTFPHTLCVVSTSDETTHCGICLTSNKNLHWASGGGSLAPPDGPCSLSFTRGGNIFWQGLKIDIFEPFFFLLALRFRSKLKQDVNISPFLNHFMLKNPWALDTFLYANQMKMYTWDKIVNFRNFCSPLSFF